MYFETKVRYDKMQENGTSVKKVTEKYLVDALSFTEAEARTLEERKPYMSGDFSVNAARKTKVAEIVRAEDAEDTKWWSVKWTITTIDEKPAAMGKPVLEKKVSCLTMVEAEDIHDAYVRFKDFMKNTLADYDIAAIDETTVLEVYDVDLNGKKE